MGWFEYLVILATVIWLVWDSSSAKRRQKDFMDRVFKERVDNAIRNQQEGVERRRAAAAGKEGSDE